MLCDGQEGDIEKYTAYTRKGQAEIGLRFLEEDDQTKLVIIVAGFGDVVEFVTARIDDDVRMFLEDEGEDDEAYHSRQGRARDPAEFAGNDQRPLPFEQAVVPE